MDWIENALALPASFDDDPRRTVFGLYCSHTREIAVTRLDEASPQNRRRVEERES